MSYPERKRWPGSSVTRDVQAPDAPPAETAPRGMSAAQAKAPRPKPVPVCSYCAVSGKPGTAIVCGRPTRCPACSVPGWAELVARFGAESAQGGT